MNPAVTIAFAIDGRFNFKKLPGYILAQIFGSILASIVLKILFPFSQYLGATLPSGSELQSFVLEGILTFILMLVILNVSTGSKEQGMFAGIAIGAVVLLEAMFAGPISGASMNPVRSLAPAVISGNSQHLWIYLTAPIIGASLAIPVFKLTQIKNNNYENSIV